MGNVIAPTSVLSVGEPYYDSAGQLQGWEGSPLFMVGFVDRAQSDSADSWERLALTVCKAARQFMHIDERGNEIGDDDLGSTEEYTPNYVSDPHLSAEGVSMTVDTKGMLSRDMGEAMLRALVEELRHLPFDTRVSGDDAGSHEVVWLPPRAQRREGTDRDGKPHIWVIERAVRCTIHDGIPDVTVEYLDTEDGWTTSLADARRFELDGRGTATETVNLAERLTLSMFTQAGRGW